MEIKIDNQEIIVDADKLAKIMYKILDGEDEYDRIKEHVWVVGVNNKGIIQYIDFTCLGTGKSVSIDPSIVFRLAIVKNSSSIFLIHNHPSGTMEHSEKDYLLTENLIKAGKILDINLADHLIIGRNITDGYYSFADKTNLF